MRNGRRCPKCQHGVILHLKRVAGELVYMARPGSDAGVTWRRATPREAYICRACGFTEYYTLDLESIPVDGDLVALLDADHDGPYR
jgi:predicted nucleic-acid-binding Zn-ribbon protein